MLSTTAATSSPSRATEGVDLEDSAAAAVKKHHANAHYHTAPLGSLVGVALAGGLAAGLVGSAFAFCPHGPVDLILDAEAYEAVSDDTDDSWGPADGAERNTLTVVGNVVFGVGYACVLLAAWTFGRKPVGGWRRGVLWGLALFAAVFGAPAYGLPPELPGMAVTPLNDRQGWWTLCVACTAAAQAVVALVDDASLRLRLPEAAAAESGKHARTAARCALGLGLLVLPHTLGAPAADAAGAHEHAVPTELVAEFCSRVPAVLVVFFATLGGATAEMFDRCGIYHFPGGEGHAAGEMHEDRML